jgi:ribosomal protein L15
VADLNKIYDFDEKLAEEGAKMIIGPNQKEDFILVRRIPNPEYQRELDKVMQASHKVLEFAKQQDPKKYEELNGKLLAKVVARTVVTGWGVVKVDGKVKKFSASAAEEILTKYPEFRGDVIDFARDRSNYPAQVDVEEVKK